MIHSQARPEAKLEAIKNISRRTWAHMETEPMMRQRWPSRCGSGHERWHSGGQGGGQHVISTQPAKLLDIVEMASRS